jgi:peptidoglycan/xylan/chitin deacetylase (PgdA/CDA1 family)
MYHSVTEVAERGKKKRSTNPAYSLTAKQFREQMAYIHKNGYKTLHIDELLSAVSLVSKKVIINPPSPLPSPSRGEGYIISPPLRVADSPGRGGDKGEGELRGFTNDCISDNEEVISTHVPEKSLVITFDDGWADNYVNVFPILREYGLIATIFVITGSVGQSNYMNWNQLREMSEAGISIQSHTVSHRPLAQLSKAEIEYELETSKKTIEDALGTDVSYSSMPHGSFDKRVLRTAQQAGYKCICTSEPGYKHTHEGIPLLKRINISERYYLQTFKKIIEKNQMTILPLIFDKKIKNLLKRTIGAGNYRKLYHLRYTIRD